MAENLKCLDGPNGCDGAVVYRAPLSGTGRSFPRCARHWDERLIKQEEIRRKYPEQPPRDFDPLAAGEHWDESA